ncbi:AraC-like DNA-binding protein [Cocleimonas flava]|uniref:AraC-like DNA-binding protein n=2 Tax=Cocleimonas flava TaxID=634765 RepID=A0A4R1FCN4_9GAMM|nr:AraC-like DNA-binding protein [Cocleimonas flava]
MINTMTFLLCGFSVISALVLIFTHLDTNTNHYQGKWLSKAAGVVLLLGLASMQLIHYDFLANQGNMVNSRFYVFLLFIVSPAFYFFIRDVLRVENSYQPIQLLHLLPALISLLIPSSTAQLFAFVFGTGYVLWLAYSIYSLRAQRSRFKLELLALFAIGLLAILVLIIGVLMPLISDYVFYTSYACLLGLSFVVIIFTLLRFPDITQEVAEAAEAAYATSTLNNLDSEALVLKLRQLLEVEKLYVEDGLSLASLAEKMGISNHQLSELINTRFKKSFSQLLREYRITEAKRLLIDEPNASVLSIGLSTGFTSQSNFYTAFKEITGMAPGNYRKTQKKHH